MIRVLRFAGLAAVLLLGGCWDEFANITVLNDTDVPIAVLKRITETADERVRAEPKAETKRVFIGRRVRIEAGTCVYAYDFPYMGVNFPWQVTNAQGELGPDYSETYPVRTQLTSDFTIYLLSSDTKGVQSETMLRTGQAHGFPLKPVSKTCRPTS